MLEIPATGESHERSRNLPFPQPRERGLRRFIPSGGWIQTGRRATALRRAGHILSELGPFTEDDSPESPAKLGEVTPPKRYEEWCALLDAFHAPDRDAEVYAAALDGEYPLSAGITERTTKRLLEAYDVRLQRLQRALQNEMNRARLPVDVERALADLVTGLTPLARFALVSTLPEKIRGHLRETLDTYATRVRETLEKSAHRPGALDGVLLSSIKRTIIVVPWASAAARLPPTHSLGEPGTRGQRRLIF